MSIWFHDGEMEIQAQAGVRAIAELRSLNKRQKDGWFADYLEDRFPRLLRLLQRSPTEPQQTQSVCPRDQEQEVLETIESLRGELAAADTANRDSAANQSGERDQHESPKSRSS